MRKRWYCMAIFAMVLMSGCGMQKKSYETTAEVTKSAAAEQSEEADAKKSDEESKTQKNGKEDKVVNLSYDYVEIYHEVLEEFPTGENRMYYINALRLELEDSKYQKINAILEEHNASLLKVANENLEEAIQTWDGESTLSMFLYMEPKVIRADSKILSVEYSFYQGIYTDNPEYADLSEGTSTNQYNRTFNFDMTTQKELKFADVVKDRDAYIETAKGIVQDLDLEGMNGKIKDEDVETIIGMEDMYFTVGYDSVSISKIDETGDFSGALWKLSVPMGEYPELFEDTYVQKPDSYMTYLSDIDLGYIDLDGDGKEEMFSIHAKEEEKEDGNWAFYFHVKTKDTEYAVECEYPIYYVEGAIARMDNNKEYLYLTGTVESSSIVYTFDLNSDKAMDVISTEFPGDLKAGYVAPRQVLSWEMSYMFGTLQVSREGHLNADGTFTPLNELYYYENILSPLKVIKEFNATKVDAEGNATGEDMVIAVGEEVMPLYTDNMEFVVLQQSDGSLIRVEIKDNEIDGVVLDLIFDGIVYAG